MTSIYSRYMQMIEILDGSKYNEDGELDKDILKKCWTEGIFG